MAKSRPANISVNIDYESYQAFIFAVFVSLGALGLVYKDHRRRQEDARKALQEDRMYRGILSTLFAISSMGAYFASQKQFSSPAISPASDPMDTMYITTQLMKLLASKLPEMGFQAGGAVPLVGWLLVGVLGIQFIARMVKRKLARKNMPKESSE